jgi:MFS family permease
VATAAFTFVVGALSAFAPSYEYLLVFRGLVGVGVGGLHVAYTLFSEFLPGSTRSWTLLLLVIFWSVGSMFEAVLAWLTLPTDPFGAPGWHALLLFSALPMLGVLLLTPLVPESPRYLIVTGQEDRALAVLADVARANGRAPFAGKLLRPRAAEPGRVKDLLSGESHLRRTTLLLWALWFAVSFCYYGVVLLVTELFASNLLDKRCGRPVEDKSGGSLGRGSHIRDDCRTLFSASDFVDVFVTSAAELPGVLLAGLLLQLVGRKTAITVHFTGGAVSILLLYICTSRLVETIELATTRAFLTGAFQIIWIYTPEVYPTNVRSTGMGLCSSYARLGGMTTPFAAQVLAVVDVDAALALYAALMVVGAVLPFFLQVETRGQPMPETPHDVRNLMAGEDAPPPHDKVN